jgi:hypothetical protein
MQLDADGVGSERAAGQAGPLDRALALFDELLAGAAVVVEGDDAFRRPTQVGDDKADARIKLAGVPRPASPAALWTCLCSPTRRSGAVCPALRQQRMVAGAAEMPVVGAAFLIAVGGALARNHVEPPC